MATKLQKVHGAIHTASAASAAVGAGLAQVPGADMPVIASLQTAMIVAIAEVHGVTIKQTAAADLLLTFSASVGGRALSQLLVGWVPGLGNAINASTAAAITEAIGWAAHAFFSKTDDAAQVSANAFTTEQVEQQERLIAALERSLASLESSRTAVDAVQREAEVLVSARQQLEHMKRHHRN
jgi:uncharacterized protein (DUF697 family)